MRQVLSYAKRKAAEILFLRDCAGAVPGQEDYLPKICRRSESKKKAENDPIVSLYNRRCGAIRTEVGRCTISKAFGETAKRLAKEHKLRALADDQYAKIQYKKDMSREALYAEVDRNLK